MTQCKTRVLRELEVVAGSMAFGRATGCACSFVLPVYLLASEVILRHVKPLAWAWPKNHINFTAVDALPVAQAPEETSQKLIRLKLLKPTARWFQLI